MKAKDLQKISDTYSKVRALDAEIIKLQKLSIKLIEKETKCSISFEIEDLTKKESAENKVNIDSDGSLNYGARISFMGRFFPFQGMIVDDVDSTDDCNFKHSGRYNLEAIEMVAVLEALTLQKVLARNNLIKELEKKGVQI